MYTFHEINIGMSFNNLGRYSDPFLKACYKLFIEEFDCNRIEAFSEKVIPEIERKNIQVEPLVKDMLDWLNVNKDKLKFDTHYHGSAENIPTNLTFKGYDVNIQDDIDNFTWDAKYLLKLNGKLEEILVFCKETMSKELYEYITKNKLIGINFLNVSS